MYLKSLICGCTKKWPSNGCEKSSVRRSLCFIGQVFLKEYIDSFMGESVSKSLYLMLKSNVAPDVAERVLIKSNGSVSGAIRSLQSTE